MEDPQLQRLLDLADTPAPPPAEGLADRVRAKHRRQRRTRNATAAILGLSLIALLILAVVQNKRPRPTSDPQPLAHAVEPPPNRLELAARIQTNQRLLQALLEAERRQALARRTAALGAQPLLALHTDRDRAAAAILHNANDLRSLPNHHPRARLEYQKVVDLFADSPLALSARAGLENLNRDN